MIEYWKDWKVDKYAIDDETHARQVGIFRLHTTAMMWSITAGGVTVAAGGCRNHYEGRKCTTRWVLEHCTDVLKGLLPENT